MILDAHVHAWPMEASLRTDRTYTPKRAFPVGDLLRLLDANEVAGAVIVQPSFLGTDNRYLLSCLSAYPDRFRGVAVVPPETTVEELDDLRAGGVAGLRLNLLHGEIPDLRSQVWRTFLDRATGAGLHIQVFAEANRMPRVLPSLVEAGCAVVIDHFGLPAADCGVDDPNWRTVLDLAGDPRHHVKLSGPYRLGGQAAKPLAERLLAAFGPARLVWASDCPWTRYEDRHGYRDCLGWLDGWVPETAARRAVAGETARTLYRF
ncbi:MAG: amidohydrolase family protein [Alphaproteobacteria bacterium]|nr:amidohydrolase family protein [Alphaproteobacteria bacterium]